MGIFPSAGVQRSLAAAARKCPKSLPVRWESEEKIHTTLVFLGEVSEEKLELLTEAIRQALKGFKPVELSTQTTGVFPRIDKPRVIWVGLGGDFNQLVSLQKRLETAILTKGFALRTRRAFSPHLTLGRFRASLGGSDLAKLQKFLKDTASIAEGHKFLVSKVSLVKSTLGPEGSIYKVIKEFSLSSKARP